MGGRRGALRVPCCYQGGKQRVAGEIVDEILAEFPDAIDDGVRFYDLCCGSGAITIELLNRGVKPSDITMLDASSWGAFWRSIGLGSFDMAFFEELLAEIPEDKANVKPFMEELAQRRIRGHEAEIFLVLQSCSFGGKQIWRDGNRWRNAFFRNYWLPKPGSVRKSPANPMQPNRNTLLARTRRIATAAYGVTCVHGDVEALFEMEVPKRSIVYVDPPYRATTGYAYGFAIEDFIAEYGRSFDAPLFVSEGEPLRRWSKRLAFGGAKGGISGTKRTKHEEWLTRF